MARNVVAVSPCSSASRRPAMTSPSPSTIRPRFTNADPLVIEHVGEDREVLPVLDGPEDLSAAWMESANRSSRKWQRASTPRIASTASIVPEVGELDGGRLEECERLVRAAWS